MLTEQQIQYMAERFLNFPFPVGEMSPDGGISIERPKGLAEGLYRSPTGTNLLNAEQASAMVRWMTNSMPEQNGEPATDDRSAAEKERAQRDWEVAQTQLADAEAEASNAQYELHKLRTEMAEMATRAAVEMRTAKAQLDHFRPMAEAYETVRQILDLSVDRNSGMAMCEDFASKLDRRAGELRADAENNNG